MQGDIFQLNSVQLQVQRASKPIAQPRPQALPTKRQEQLVSIYNEDDLSHFLFLPSRSLDDLEVHNHATTTQDHAHYLGVIASAFDDYCMDTPYDSSDECAVYSDVEDEVETPLDGYSMPPRRPRADSRARSSASADASPGAEGGGCQSAQKQARGPAQPEAIPATQHVSSISGQLMGWWPLPLDKEEYDWIEENKKDAAAHAAAKQVDEIEGKLMSWWPLSTDSMEYDWNDKFYE